MIKLLEHTRRPDISFYRNGTIRITTRLARTLSIQPGDALNIAIVNGEYLLYATHNCIGRHEAQCHPSKKGGENYCANSVRLCRAFFNSIGSSANKVAYMVGEAFLKNNTLYVPIITRFPL